MPAAVQSGASFHPFDNPKGEGIEHRVRAPDIDAGKRERRHNDEETDRDADRRHAAGDRDRQQPWREGDDGDEPEVDDQHGDGQGPREPLPSLDQIVKQRLILDLLDVPVTHGALRCRSLTLPCNSGARAAMQVHLDSMARALMESSQPLVGSAALRQSK